MSGPKVCGGHQGEIVGISVRHCEPGRCAICGARTDGWVDMRDDNEAHDRRRRAHDLRMLELGKAGPFR